MTDQERYEKINELLQELLASLLLMEALEDMSHEAQTMTGTSLDIVDFSYECSMCGKPMPYRFVGMCTHCEMIWNG